MSICKFLTNLFCRKNKVKLKRSIKKKRPKGWLLMRTQAKNEFVRNNRELCKAAFDIDRGHKGFKTKEGQALIEKARQVLVYKETYWSGDIYWTLSCEYKKQNNLN